MMRPLVLGLGLIFGAAPLAASECHYFWTTDCFEIRDPMARDITHHVLLSEQRFQVPAKGEQCPLVVENELSPEQRDQVLKAFNRQLKKLSGCRALETLPPKVFDSELEAINEWQRLAAERSFKQLHLIRRLPR